MSDQSVFPLSRAWDGLHGIPASLSLRPQRPRPCPQLPEDRVADSHPLLTSPLLPTVSALLLAQKTRPPRPPTYPMAPAQKCQLQTPAGVLAPRFSRCALGGCHSPSLLGWYQRSDGVRIFITAQWGRGRPLPVVPAERPLERAVRLGGVRRASGARAPTLPSSNKTIFPPGSVKAPPGPLGLSQKI